MLSKDSHGTGLPSTSVIIPALNCVEEVDDCVAALRAQDYPADRIQIVVADNGSSDGTPERLKELGVQTVTRKERGRSRALNAGLEVATGDVILTTDMSCIARSDWIRKVVSCFEDPAVGCVAGDIEMIPNDSNMALRFQMRNRYMSPLSAFSRRELPFLPYADGANASFRREVFEQIGGFEESFFKAADVEICYRLLILTNYKIVFCPECLMTETGEPDLGALLHQRYRMGQGAHLMRARFPDLYQATRTEGGVKQIYWSFRDRISSSGNALGHLLKGDRDRLEDALVRKLMWRAQQRGHRQGEAFLRDQPTQPDPVDAHKTLAFMQHLQEELEERVVMSAGIRSPASVSE